MRGVLLALAALLVPRPGAAASRGVAVVTAIVGKLEVQPDGSKAYHRAKVGDFLHEGDTVRTGEGDRAAMAYLGGIEVKINEKTSYSITARKSGIDNRLRQLKLQFGQIWAKLLTSANHDQLLVHTPTAVCAVRGSDGDIRHDDVTTFMLYTGHGSLENAFGSTPLVGGQYAQAGPGAAPSSAQPIPQTKRQTWQEGVNESGDTKKLLDNLKSEGPPE